MTLSANYDPVRQEGDGNSKNFSFDFSILQPDYLKVFLEIDGVQYEQEQGVDYTLIYNNSGGIVSFVSAPAAGQYIIIIRETVEDQEVPFKTSDGFQAKVVEQSLDKLTAIAQEQQDEINRSPKVAPGVDIDLTLPNPEPGKTLVWNEAGIGLKNSDVDIDDLETELNKAVDEANAAALSAKNDATSSGSSATASANSATNAQNTATNFINITVPAAVEKVSEAGAEKVEEAKEEADDARQSALKAATYAERVRSEGIPMSVIEQKRSETSCDTVKLWWQDPRDTIIDGFVLSSWKSTTIVKKQGSYPQDVDDGIVVEIVTTRNKYLNEPLVDTQENASEWCYRAFPLSVNGVYNLDKRNSFGVVLYGYRINEIDPVPSTRVEYLPFCDNYFYDPCVMDFVSDVFSWGSWRKAFFIPKPCALSYSGTVDYYLNPDNFTLKENGTASGVSNTGYGGNFMSEFPAVFTKVYKENNYIYVLFSNIKLDDEFECWSCKKADGTYAPNFYLPMFEGTNVSNVLRSVATNGKPTSTTNAETEATLAIANGVGWNTTLWADEVLMMLLFPLLFKSTDSQGKLGFGGSASTTGLTVNNDAALTRGLMYGTAGASAFGMTYLGLHNWYGHRWRRPNGLMNANGDIKVKMTTSTVDGSTVSSFNRTGNGYMSTGFRPPEASSSYINRFEPIGNGKFGVVPKAVTGSSTTLYCDGMWTHNGQLNQLFLGGSVANGAINGVFCFHVADHPSSSIWHFGASPSYHNL